MSLAQVVVHCIEVVTISSPLLFILLLNFLLLEAHLIALNYNVHDDNCLFGHSLGTIFHIFSQCS